MSTDLIVAAIVIPAVLLAAFVGYWSGRDAGIREANTRRRTIARHPSHVRVVDDAEREPRIHPRLAQHLHVAPDEAS